MSDAAAGALPVFSGVTLVQYASITAAIAEGFALDEVLGLEEIPARAWASGKLAWKQRLVRDSMTSGEVFEAYQRELAAAEDRLSRLVHPLDTEVGAWVIFLAAHAASPTPFDWLAGLGLGVNDVSRLERRWSARIDADPALQRQVAELRKKPRGPLPPLRLEPSRLVRSMGAAAPPKKPDEAPPPAPVAPALALTGLEVEGASLLRHATLCAEIEAAPGDLSRVLQRYGLSPEAHAALDQAFRAQLAASPRTARDFRTLLDHARRRLARAEPGEPPAPAPAAPAFSPQTTVVATSPFTPPAEALPFQASSSPEQALLSALAHAAATQGPPAPGPASSGETIDIGALVAAEQGALRVATVPLDSLPPPSGELPFRAGSAEEALASALRHAEAVQGPPRAPLASGQTVEIHAPAAPAPVPLPQFTLLQYASLCVEIALAPERLPEILIRYHLTSAGRDALDAHFRAVLTADPRAREEFARAFAQYRAVLTGGR